MKYILKCGLQNNNSKIGIYMGDSDCYSIFKPIINSVIKQYHKFDPDRDKIKGENIQILFTNDELNMLSTKVVTTRIRLSRNLVDFPFPSSMNKA